MYFTSVELTWKLHKLGSTPLTSPALIHILQRYRIFNAPWLAAVMQTHTETIFMAIIFFLFCAYVVHCRLWSIWSLLTTVWWEKHLRTETRTATETFYPVRGALTRSQAECVVKLVKAGYSQTEAFIGEPVCWHCSTRRHKLTLCFYWRK